MDKQKLRNGDSYVNNGYCYKSLMIIDDRILLPGAYCCECEYSCTSIYQLQAGLGDVGILPTAYGRYAQMSIIPLRDELATISARTRTTYSCSLPLASKVNKPDTQACAGVCMIMSKY